MTLNNVIFCLSFGMLSYMFIGNAFAKDLTAKDGLKLVKSMLAKKSTELYIEERDGYTEIAEGAFCYETKGYGIFDHGKLDKITKIIIPNTVQKIGKRAFAELDKLQTVEISNSVNEIGEEAFLENEKMNKIVIPNSVEKIGDRAFHKCAALKSIKIPGSVHSLGVSAFAECTSLERADFEDGHGEYKLKKLYQTFKECKNLKTVNLPNTVEMILGHTFFNCKNLQSIKLPKSLTNVNTKAFQNCERLQDITVYASTNIENQAFLGCNNVQNITVIGAKNKADKDRIELQLSRSGMLTRTNNIKDIIKYVDDTDDSEDYSVDNNKSKKHKSLPVESSNMKDSKSSKSKGSSHKKSKSADYSTTNYVDTSSKKSKSFVKVTSSRSNIQSNVITSQPYGNVLTRNIVYATLKQDFVIPEGYTTIEPRAFEGRNVISITIPKSMTVIGPNAFSGCTSLKTLKIHQKVTAIDVNAFTGCQGVAVQILYDGTNLPKADIDNIESIFRQPFNGGYWKRDWVASTSVEAKNTGTASQSAVRNDLVTAGVVNSLTRNNGELVIPEGYTSIDANAFYGKQNINSITIPMSMTVIGPNAFSGCTSLKTLKIHPKVTGIDVNAFTGCQGVAVQVLYDGTNLPKADIDKIESIFGQTFNGGYWKRDWIAK